MVLTEEERKARIARLTSGIIARRDGSVDWLDRPRPRGNYGMGTFYRSIDTCVLGRKTYDLSVRFGMAEAWTPEDVWATLV